MRLCGSVARSAAFPGRVPARPSHNSSLDGLQRRNAAAGRYERSQFGIAQDPGRRNCAEPGKRLGIEYLRQRIVDGDIRRKATNNAVANGTAIGRPIPRNDEVERHGLRLGPVKPFGLDEPGQGAQGRSLFAK